MSRLFKSGVWIFIVCAIGFILSASGVCGPTSDLGTYVAEATMIGAPVGIAICIFAGLRALFRQNPH
jgi:hypothetical protein